MSRSSLRVRARKTGAVVAAGLAIPPIVLATAWTATDQSSYVDQANERTVSVVDTVTTTGLTEPSGTATADPGGTDSNAGTGLTFTVISVGQPSLTIAKNHANTFIQGEDGVYTITVGSAAAAGPTNGTTVTVHDILPAGLRAGRITGGGWHCILATLTCTRSDVLPAGHSYPPVSLKVHVPCNARARLTNIATVTGGGDTTTHTATDTTTIKHYEHHGRDGGGHDGHDRRHDQCEGHDR
ncbi:DUF11 domain-containing protein [Streptomyces sp. MI02-2A]|uniref:DUF11 domain-containing protein n=1 Tax=unclassified Streptomyces TaxID=2593676 RepID=UPI000A5525F0|nr:MULTISPECIES: DUF11 domain-containing protein [unclassified Streptomyces]MDX3263873.1 DUF11 domain-containing protein [Streptomyces sp. MI02-2A]